MAHNAKSFTLDAATNGIADFMASIHAHFNTNAQYWSLELGSDADAIVLINNATPGLRVSIRRSGTASIETSCDPGNGALSPGSAASGPSGSTAQYSGEQAFNPSLFPNTFSPRFFITEYPDAIAVLFQDTGKSYTPGIILAGKTYQPMRADYASFGVDGHSVQCGRTFPSNGSNYFIGETLGSSLDSAIIKAGDTWRNVFTASFTPGGVALSSGAYKRPISPVILYADNGGGSGRDTMVGLSTLLGWYPGTDQAGQGQGDVRTLYSDGTDGWLAIRDTSATTTSLLLAWETGKPLS